METLAEKLMANEMLKKPQIHLIVEFITTLLLVVENDAILVVCNKLSKIAYFVVTTERISVEELVRLFSNNIQKLYGLLKNVILDREPQFTVKLTKELNRMSDIKMKLLISFHPQMNGPTKYMSQELEQYLWFFINHRQKNWLEWLVTVQFAINNKPHSVTKVSPFMVNYRRELKIGADIRRKKIQRKQQSLWRGRIIFRRKQRWYQERYKRR